MAGLVLVAAGLASFTFMGSGSAYIGAPLAGFLAFAAGSALTFSGAMVAAVAHIPADQSGLAGGVVNTAMETGATVGFAVLISLGDLAFGAAAVVCAATAAIATHQLRKETTP